MDGIQPTFNMGGDNCFGGSGIWLFAILALLFGGNGWFGNGNNGRTATTEDVNNSANFTRLESRVGETESMVDRTKDVLSNGISDLGYETAKMFADTNSKICGLSKEILENRYYTEKAIMQQGCEIKTIMQQNKIEELTRRINELEIRDALGNVVRYPNQTVYSLPVPSKSTTPTT